ncbi:MAG: TolC family protein, partial [Candidatus Omnitrophica bacterium]|nr:TolC family protein [Candidatus Omnitrophota bacterium]
SNALKKVAAIIDQQSGNEEPAPQAVLPRVEPAPQQEPAEEAAPAALQPEETAPEQEPAQETAPQPAPPAAIKVEAQKSVEPSSTKELIKQAKKSYQKKNYTDARAGFEKVLRARESLQGDAGAKEARGYLAKIDREIAKQNERIEKKKSKENARLNEATIKSLVKESKALYKNRDYQAAKTKCEEALKLNPKSRDVINQLDMVSRRQARIDGKKERIRSAAEKKIFVAREKEKNDLEKKAFGFWGVNEKGVTGMLNAIPNRDIPQRPLDLEECVDIALKNNIRLEVARKQFKLARLRILEAKRNLGPTLKMLWEESGGQVSGRQYEGRKINVDYNQPIYHGGELIYTLKQNQVNYEVVKTDYDRVKNELVLQVEKAYFSLDKSIKALGIQQKLYDKSTVINDQTKRGYEFGVISKIEYFAVLSKYNQAGFQIASAKEDVTLAKLILAQAMNTEENVDIIAIGDPALKTISLEDCYQLALKHRPEMKVNYLMVEYYLYEKQISMAKQRFKLDFLGNWGFAYEDFVPWDNEEGHRSHKFQPQWYTGVKASLPFGDNTLTYSYTKERWQPVVSAFQGTESATHDMGLNIFDGLQRDADVAEADIGLGKAQQEYNKVREEIVMEVQETYFKYKKAMLQMDVAKSKVEYQNLQLDITEMKKEINEAGGSSVLDELVKWGEEQFGLIQAILDYYIALKSLNKAIGINGYF